MGSAESRGARIRSNVFAYANLAPYVFFVLFPFYFMVVTSFKSNAELYNLKSIPFWIQSGVIMDHYALLFQKTDFVTWMKNSLGGRGGGDGGLGDHLDPRGLQPGPPALPRRRRLRHRHLHHLPDPADPALPPLVAGRGLARARRLDLRAHGHLPDLPGSVLHLAAHGLLPDHPREVEECALVDGATRMQTLSKIVLPMAIPGVICAALFSFTLCWNEFTYALTFISQSANKTAVVGVTSDLIRGDIYFWGSLMAGALLASIPIVVIYVIFLDYYVSGLTAGAVKG